MILVLTISGGEVLPDICHKGATDLPSFWTRNDQKVQFSKGQKGKRTQKINVNVNDLFIDFNNIIVFLTYQTFSH